MKMLAVKMLWHMDTLSPPCFLISLQAVSYFSIDSLFFKTTFRGMKKKGALGLSPADSCDHDADIFPDAQTRGLEQSDEQRSFLHIHLFLAELTHTSCLLR